MNEQSLAAQVAQLAGPKFTEQAATNLIAAYKEDKVRQMLQAAQSESDGGLALTRLRNRLFCVSDRVGQAVGALGIKTDARGVLRAAQFDGNVVQALRAVLGQKQTADDVTRIRQAFEQTAQDATQPPARPAAQAPAQRGAGSQPGAQQSRPAASQARQNPEPQRPTSRAGGAANEEAARRGKNKHVYGGKAALCFELTRNKDDRLAMKVDGATAVGVRQYDWLNKTIIQLSEDEMFGVMGVLLGPAGRIEYTGHGPEHDKAFSIERQNANFFVKVSRKGAMAAVPVAPMDSRALTLMIAEALVAEHPVLRDIDGIRAFLYGRDEAPPAQAKAA